MEFLRGLRALRGESSSPIRLGTTWTMAKALPLLVLAGVWFVPVPGAADETDARRRDEFFESRVRPVLIEHCVACHGPEKQKSGLRLDSARGLHAGGSGGPV